ncbi:MAG: hypothetical protein FWF00_07310 [Endomicrobia bacterium]|nr:hypothetical protein [Endomicrobiia bacterium]MCL2507475.1 hypothetical protein [Endomicrobiia bacterium]
MRLLKFFILSIFLTSILACGTSYDKDKLTDQLEALIKKECKTDSQAFIVGKTLYLDMELDSITSKEQQQAAAAVQKMQTAVMSIVRVVLSSNSEIQFMIVSVFDKDKNVLFRIIQNIEDIKSYYYMRISRGDFQSRNIMEIEGPDYAETMINDKRDMSIEEYVGRMIASQIDMASRSNPFFGALMSMARLRYAGYEDGVLILSTMSEADEKTESLINVLVAEETKKYAEKYGLDFTSVRIINLKNDQEIKIELE